MPTNGHMPGSEVLLGKCEGEALAIAMGPHPRGAADLERIDQYVEEWVEVLPWATGNYYYSDQRKGL